MLTDEMPLFIQGNTNLHLKIELMIWQSILEIKKVKQVEWKRVEYFYMSTLSDLINRAQMREPAIGGSSLSAQECSQPSITARCCCWSVSSTFKEVTFIQTVQVSTRPHWIFTSFHQVSSLPNNNLLIKPRGRYTRHDVCVCLCVWELVCLCVCACVYLLLACVRAGRPSQAVGFSSSGSTTNI